MTLGVVANVAFIVLNVTLFFTGFWAVHLFYAGFHVGLMAAIGWSWWVDRKLNQEIMEEIDSLTKNYDQQQLFPWTPDYGYDFPENLNQQGSNPQ